MAAGTKKILFYAGINETAWNYQKTAPGSHACISPIYGKTERTRRENRVKIPVYTKVIQDSGAFSDGRKSRLSLSEALDRQYIHSDKYKYTEQITHRASYDLLIDEVWINGNRYKRRWTENEAKEAVNITIDAAKYMAMNYSGGKILSAQGVTPNQYFDCSLRVIEWLSPKDDVFGLGGWCISGKMPAIMREPFDDTMILVIPEIAAHNIKRVHIWGVMSPVFLGPLLYLCDEYQLTLSTDSSGPSVRPILGQWGYAGWRKKITPPDLLVRGTFRALHIIETRCWLKNLRETKFYAPPKIKPKQLMLF